MDDLIFLVAWPKNVCGIFMSQSRFIVLTFFDFASVFYFKNVKLALKMPTRYTIEITSSK